MTILKKIVWIYSLKNDLLLNFAAVLVLYYISINNDLVAQLVEQQTLNLWVEGSNPSWVTIILDKKTDLYSLSVSPFFFIVICEVSIAPTR